jgi:hypothetical protein
MCRFKTNLVYWEPIFLISKILFYYELPLHLPIVQALLSHVKKRSRCIGRQKTQDIFVYIVGNYKEISVGVMSITGV